jgi:hypothetical protein
MKIIFNHNFFEYLNFSDRIKTHLSNVGVQRLPAHVGVKRAIGIGALPLHSRGPNTLKLKEGKIFLDKNIKPFLLL